MVLSRKKEVVMTDDEIKALVAGVATSCQNLEKSGRAQERSIDKLQRRIDDLVKANVDRDKQVEEHFDRLEESFDKKLEILEEKIESKLEKLTEKLAEKPADPVFGGGGIMGLCTARGVCDLLGFGK